MPGPSPKRPTALFTAYRAASALIAPFAYRKVARKLADYGITAERQRERLGYASQPRPTGQLIWFHAASVGESLSVLTLVTRLGQEMPDAAFLITSGTPTSAELIAKRMPPRTRHQFPPLDSGAAVDRFLAHWRPDLAVFVESELWPQMLVRTRQSGCPLVLLNARLSPKSVAGWQKRAKTAGFLLDQFDLFLTQNDETAQNLASIGANPDRIRPGSNLKASSAPLPVDQESLSTLRLQLGSRPLWTASSTHAGEEGAVLAAHKELLAERPDLCLLLVPRHPNRGDEVADLIAGAGLSSARRSRGESISPTTQVYLADTLGELGTFYALCPLVFLGGSLREIGGHNPFEVMQHGGATISGTGHYNFKETFAALTALGAAREVADDAALAPAVADWLDHPEALAAACAASETYMTQQSDQLDQTITTLTALTAPHTQGGRDGQF